MSKFVDLGQVGEGIKGQEMYVIMHQKPDGTVDSVMMAPDQFDGYDSVKFHLDVAEKTKNIEANETL